MVQVKPLVPTKHQGDGHCETCGIETPLLKRYIGFFGKVDVFSRWCREHLIESAVAEGLDVELVLHDWHELIDREAKRQATRTQQPL